jgi:fluoroacetyl-CoA thioesterase
MIPAMPLDTLRIGLTHSETITVTDRLTVPEMADAFAGFEGMPPVLATAYMVAFVEWTCVRAMAPHLLPGEHSVGTHVDLSHIAATPAGMSVTAEVQLVVVEGRKLRFRAACRDARDAISIGHHERVVIDQRKFLDKLATKRAG